MTTAGNRNRLSHDWMTINLEALIHNDIIKSEERGTDLVFFLTKRGQMMNKSVLEKIYRGE